MTLFIHALCASKIFSHKKKIQVISLFVSSLFSSPAKCFLFYYFCSRNNLIFRVIALYVDYLLESCQAAPISMLFQVFYEKREGDCLQINPSNNFFFLSHASQLKANVISANQKSLVERQVFTLDQQNDIKYHTFISFLFLIFRVSIMLAHFLFVRKIRYYDRYVVYP